MATAQPDETLEIDQNSPPPAHAAPPKRGPGRPPGPAKKPDAEEPSDWGLTLTKFTPTDWLTRVLYLYRLAPITDRRGPGRAKNLTKYSEAIDADRIMREHGSGRYRLDFVYIPPDGSGAKRIAQYDCEIMNPDYPPKIPAGDWVDDPRNDEWKWCRAAENPAAAAGAPAAAAGTTPDQIVSAVVKLLERTRPDLLGDNNKADVMAQVVAMVNGNQERMLAAMDPTKQLATLQALIQAIRPPGDGASPLIDIYREQVREMREEMRALRENQGKKTSLLDELTSLEAIAEKLGFSRGRGKAQGASEEHPGFWVRVADKAVDELAPAVNAIAQGFFADKWAENKRKRDAAAASTATKANATALPQATRSVAPNPQAAPPPTQAQQQTNPVASDPQKVVDQVLESLPEEDRITMMQLAAKFGGVFRASIPHMVDYFKNDTGYDFRDWFILRHTLGCWKDLKAEAGVEKLITLARFDAGLWAALQPENELREFLTEFFTVPGEEPPGTYAVEETTKA